MGTRRNCQLDFFEFELGTLWIYMLSLNYVDADLSSFMKDFDGSTFATHVKGEDPVTAWGSESIKVYQPGVEAAWNTTSQLREAAKLMIQEPWQESLLP
jgi:hypothetical protein